MYTKINSFREVEISNKKTLIICDIDDTVLKYKKTFSDFNNNDYYFPGETDLQKKLEFALEFYQMYKIIMPIDIEHTDYDGYCEMLAKLTADSGLIFLTARTSNGHDMTMKQLQQLNIHNPPRDIYYTDNKCSKGEYIMKNMDLSDWDEIIFIDDSERQILSVACAFPKIRCYLFDFL